MQVKLRPEVWLALGLDDPDKLLVARSMFYLGYSTIHIQRMVKFEANTEEKAGYVETARFLGMNEHDTVEKV